MAPEFTSRISGFYKKSVEERIEVIAGMVGLTGEEAAVLRSRGGLSLDEADHMTENVVGTIAYPFSVAVNFRVNGRDLLVPMAGEEPSVVAAASNMARLMRDGDGINATATDPIMIGQVQILDVPDMKAAVKAIERNKEALIASANELDPVLVRFGGGAKDIELRPIETEIGPMLIVHILVDCRDAMGANAVNTMAEALAPTIAELASGRPLLRIISNLADRRLVTVEGLVRKEEIGGKEAVDNIVAAWAFADADPYRAATHNKGIMNGVAAVALALAQDHRAIEAGAHAYAVRGGRYRSMSRWSKNRDGNLVGTMTLPMAVGLVGGATRSHPMAQIARKILRVDKAADLGMAMCAVGLAQNLGALRALTQEGIQHGHMRLHARNLVVMAGATGSLIDVAAKELVDGGEIRFPKAQEIVKRLKGGS
ncbi:hydroxymethylglutaryl-CoA reductase, degradative [Candidatus Bathyarchaeota archaeon RBG_16_57_9]|jgi:hydroxymethylglutaryl-CoA reductase|nr:MAG: hydroxymethylglutaryl-CoA reductase, degradative [Candidatus Bathyarchaeota archaeon RBG_16_57_9]OGD55060.1 MAG: hydroxymethylglutaryl-CoA reductase, degradative [Candidatus Bathyarchaeota archaeon RBG_13_60_20]